MLVTILAGIVAGLVVYRLLERIFGSQRHDLRKIPKPWGLPLVGNLPTLLGTARRKQIQVLLRTLHNRYGEIFRLQVFGKNLIYVTDADACKKVLTDNLTFIRSPVLSESLSIIGKYGLVQLEGAEWRRHRKLLQPGFGPSHLRRSVEITNNVCDELFQIWDNLVSTGDGRINAFDHATAGTLDVIGHLAFSYNFRTVEALVDPTIDVSAMKAADTLFQMVTLRVNLPPYLRKYFGVHDEAGAEHLARIHTVINAAVRSKMDDIKKRREDLERAEGDEDLQAQWSRQKHWDFLDRLLEGVSDTGSRMTLEEVVDECVVFYFAGHETTSNTLVWALLSLCEHPAVMARVVEEVDRVLGGRKPTWDDLSHLEYLDRVVREVTRLYPVLPMINRRIAADTELMGHRIPAGAVVFCSSYMLHRNPRYWKDPEAFDPDRFLETPYPGSFTPFGDGPRVCIGNKLAMYEIKVFLSRIAQRYHMRLVPGQSLDAVTTVTMGLKHGLLLDISRRSE